MGKDTVVIRSDVNPSLNDSPFLKYPDQVRDYFKQYGHCDAIYDAHVSRGGLVMHTVVLLFRESAAANRVKQKYNGRVLKGARVTTSWLDIRQFRELGMPDALKHQMNLMATNFAKEKQAGRGRLGFRRGRGRGRGRGRSPALSSDQEFSYSSRSQSGTDSESVDSFSFGSKPHRPSTPSGQGSSFKFLDAPKEGRRERLESSERPSSRTSSHSQSSWNEGDREGPRKRKDPSPPVNYGKGKDVDGGEKGSEKKKAVSQMLYVPRSKRKMEDGGESPGVDMKSVFDRLGPTKDQEKDLHQLETFGDVATKKSKPNDSSLLSPKTLSKEGSPKSVSATPEKESVTLAVGAVDDGKKENSRRSSERDDKKGRSSRHGSEHDSSRHKRSRKKSASDKDRPKSKERTDREKVKAEHGDTVKQSMRREAHVSTPTTPSDINAAIEDPGTPPLPPEPSVPPTYDPQWLEYYRQASNQGQVQDLAQGHLDPSTMGPAGDGEQVPSQWTAALGKKQRSSSASSKLGLKRVDKEAALAVLQEFDSQALLLATSTKLLLSNCPSGHVELHHSMDAAVWQLVNRLLAEL